MPRTAILISCSKEEAGKIRARAAADQRGTSSYMIRVLMRAVDFDERLLQQYGSLTRLPAGRWPGARTAIMLRCSQEQADRIRAAAQRRRTTISRYILVSLNRSWDVGVG